jgi:hypothetical protein
MNRRLVLREYCPPVAQEFHRQTEFRYLQAFAACFPGPSASFRRRQHVVRAMKQFRCQLWQFRCGGRRKGARTVYPYGPSKLRALMSIQT